MLCKVAICSKDGFGGVILDKAKKLKDEKLCDEVSSFINEARVGLEDKWEILSWDWVQWDEASPVMQFVLKHTPKKRDIIVIDGDDNILRNENACGVLGIETTITWTDKRFSDAYMKNDRLKKVLSALCIKGKTAKEVLSAVREIYG